MNKNKYFANLDFLRGIAAIVVVIFHERIGFGMLHSLSLLNIVGHGYLAVDFFFQLSGFIVAASYDEKLKCGLRVTAFLKHRLIRLYPLIFFSVLLGAFTYSMPGKYNLHVDLPLILRQLALIPIYEHHKNAFPFDFPLWSITFELIVNVIFAIGFKFLTNKKIAVLIVLSSMITISLAVIKNSIDFGAGYPGFPGGLPRTTMSFFMGVLIYRHLGELPRSRIPAYLGILILASILLAPIPKNVSWVYDVFSVTIIFPFIIWCSSTVSKGNFIHRLFGNISYPIYLLHAPLIIIGISVGLAAGYNIESISFGLIVILFVVVISVMLLKLWDEPIRARLNKTFPLLISAH